MTFIFIEKKKFFFLNKKCRENLFIFFLLNFNCRELAILVNDMYQIFSFETTQNLNKLKIKQAMVDQACLATDHRIKINPE